jgi:hypothetical protein
MKKLKIWNGRGTDRHLNGSWIKYLHFYVCAYSVSDAVKLMNELGVRMTAYEIKTYFSDGCWGNAMDGITPERGLWGIRCAAKSVCVAKPERIL